MKKKSGIAREKRYLPEEKYPYLLLHVYDTYTYYIYT